MKTAFSKKTHMAAALALGVAIGVVGIGCGSSSSSTPAAAATSTDATSLTTVPTTDVSSYDPTTSATTSSSVSVAQSLSKSVTKSGGDNKYDTRHAGMSSRAGCEQNMHKREIIRHSQQSQLDRCYIQAFEEAGIISIPTDGTRKAFGFVPPTEDTGERTKKCEGIPTERTKEKEACEKDGEGPSGGAVAARVGIIDSVLQIDVCSGKTLSALTLENESRYSGGTTPTFKVVRIGKHGGSTEKNTISGSLTGVAAIADGEVTLGDDGKATVTASMNGGFGSGSMIFEANKLNYSMTGGFKGGFKDPFSESETSFTGKVFAKVGKEKSTDSTIKGTAKFSFTGAPPAMPFTNMIPFDMGGAQKENFIKTFGAEMGINLTLANHEAVYVCPNPNFDPENPSLGVKPMTAVAKGVACSTVTHTGVESFEVTNVQETGNYGKKNNQTFKSIENTASPFATEVTAKDVTAISADAAEIAFERNWDCKDISTTLDLSNPSTLSAEMVAKLTTLESKMEKCFLLEERGRDNEGMGGHNCGGQEMSVIAENIKDDPPSFGNAGGDYTLGTATCVIPGQSSSVAPSHLFFNVINANDKKYCLPSSGGCTEIVIDASTESGLSLTISDSLKITQIAYGAGTGVTTPATTADITFEVTSSQGTMSCTETYAISQPTFTKPVAPPTANEFPAKCKAAGITTPDSCAEFCRKPENKGCM